MTTSEPAPRMEGKICLVTGATNGIGLETAGALAKMGATVIVVGRNPSKTMETVRTLQRDTGNSQISALVADLSLMADVRRLAGEFKARYDRLHVLVNNAGGVFYSRQVTAEGREMTFALNHLNYFLLTNLLLDVLKASAPARIVSVSSGAHLRGKLRFDDLELKQGFSAFSAYSNSKLMNIVFTYELARRLAGTNVTANVLHPGFVRTGFGQTGGIFARLIGIMQAFALSPQKGAETSIYLATSPDVEGVSGKYFVRCKPVASNARSYQQADWARLWEVSQAIVGL